MSGTNSISIKNDSVNSMINNYNNTIIGLAQETHTSLIPNIRDYKSDYNIKNFDITVPLNKTKLSIPNWYKNIQPSSVRLNSITNRNVRTTNLNDGVSLNLNNIDSLSTYFDKTLAIGDRLTITSIYQVLNNGQPTNTNFKDLVFELSYYNNGGWESIQNIGSVSNVHNNILNASNFTYGKHLFLTINIPGDYQFKLSIRGTTNDNDYEIRIKDLKCFNGTIALNSIVNRKELISYENGEIQVSNGTTRQGLIGNTLIQVGDHPSSKYNTLSEAITNEENKNYYLVGDIVETQDIVLPPGTKLYGNNHKIDLVSYNLQIGSDSEVQDLIINGGDDSLYLSGANILVQNIVIDKLTIDNAIPLKINILLNSIIDGITIENTNEKNTYGVSASKIENCNIRINKIEMGFKSGSSTIGTGFKCSNIIGSNVWIGEISYKTTTSNWNINTYEVNGIDYTLKLEKHTHYDENTLGENPSSPL